MEEIPQSATPARKAQKASLYPGFFVTMGIIIGVLAGEGRGYSLLLTGISLLLGIITEILYRRLPKNNALIIGYFLGPLIVLTVTNFFLGNYSGIYGPAPTFIGKVISVDPATDQTPDRYGNARLGTVVLQASDGSQLQLVVERNASGQGCSGIREQHLSDIPIGEMETVRYWPDNPDSAVNTHRGHCTG